MPSAILTGITPCAFHGWHPQRAPLERGEGRHLGAPPPPPDARKPIPRRLLSNPGCRRFAISTHARSNGRMQGSLRPDRQLLDASALCRHLLGEGSVHAFLAEHRCAVFPDDLFTDLFSTNCGRPSVPADVVATVMVLQALEGLSDR